MSETKSLNCYDALSNDSSALFNSINSSTELSASHPSDEISASGCCFSSFSYNENFDPNTKKAGRRTGDDTIILSLFSREKNNRPPKKEYLRCQLIRGHKRMIRNLGSDIIPRKTLNKAKICREIFETYNKLKICYEKNKEVLNRACQTINGPKTDGQAKRQKIKEDRDISRSYNNKYCKSYFESSEVRESYQLYIDYLFANAGPSELSKKFKFSCCKSEKHNDECIIKWNILRHYVSLKMIQDLGVRPWQYCDVTVVNQEEEGISQENLKISILTD
ncbi:unnamed protein product [Blepharisma stoltei]|uniref:Uncharacterized protein n=1 Tax=Blepharisma stoltei TaxID=1481888 RepID=A0AAU9IU59_9CILI|nr:unnamed protein product [Blepharisma stoltei]